MAVAATPRPPELALGYGETVGATIALPKLEGEAPACPGLDANIGFAAMAFAAARLRGEPKPGDQRGQRWLQQHPIAADMAIAQSVRRNGVVIARRHVRHVGRSDQCRTTREILELILPYDD
jgi:hypothetical protein